MRKPNAVMMRSGWALIVAIAYLVAAILSLRLTESDKGIATMWPPGGIVLAALLVSRHRATGSLIAGCAVASLVANLFVGHDVWTSIGFTIANMTEAMVATLLLRRGHIMPSSFITPRDVARFGGAVGVAALTSAIIGSAVEGFAGFGFFASWFATDLLGMLIVTPMIVTGFATFEDRSTGTLGQTALLLGLVAAVSCAVFSQSSYPLLFLPMMALLVATYRLGPFGAATGVLIIAIVSSVSSGIGEGPLALIRARDGDVVWFLQFYLVSLFATALPIAALLVARSTLMKECAESEHMHRLLADQSRDIVARLDLDGVPLYASSASRRLLGYEPEDTIGVARIDFIHPEDRAAVMKVWQSVLRGTPDSACVYRERCRDGRYVWMEATYSLVTDPVTDAPIEVVASIRDISQRRTAEFAAAQAHVKIEESNRLLIMAERIANVGHWRLDLDARTVFWSPGVYRIHAVDPSAHLNLDEALAFYHPDDVERVSETVNRSGQTGEGFEFTARIRRSDGEIRNVVSRGEPEFDADGRLIALFGVLQDVSRQVEIEGELEAARIAAENATKAAILIADTDVLTNVASRRKTLRALSDELADAQISGRPLSIAIFDLDHFKSINDRFGHAAGDDVLRMVAQVAQTSVRSGDLVGRIGGEEFLVIFPGSDAALAMTAAERLRSAIECANDAGRASLSVTISMGVAELSAEEPGDLATLLHKADCALYAAKQAGRNRLRLAA